MYLIFSDTTNMTKKNHLYIIIAIIIYIIHNMCRTVMCSVSKMTFFISKEKHKLQVVDNLYFIFFICVI